MARRRACRAISGAAVTAAAGVRLSDAALVLGGLLLLTAP